jgi:hypothetical protein
VSSHPLTPPTRAALVLSWLLPLATGATVALLCRAVVAPERPLGVGTCILVGLAAFAAWATVHLYAERRWR